MEGKLIKLEESKYTLVYKEGSIAWENNPAFDGKLSLKNCQAIENGYDLDELAKSLYLKSGPDDISDTLSFKIGFQKAVELLGDKKFSEEHIKVAADWYYETKGKKSIDEYIQSLQQTEWDVTVEMEYVGECNGNNDEGCFQDSPGHNCGCFERRPKLDAEGCLILKRK